MTTRVSQPEIPDHQARAQALDPQGSFIVQAPAGSGKTTLLAMRYVELLAGVDRPEEILAITFTKKAAAEMRHRVLALLAEDTTQAKNIRARSDASGWQLFSNPNVLKIQTIDSFALEIASQTPFLDNAAGLGITEHAVAFYQQAATQLLGKLYRNNPSNLLLAEFLAFLDNDAGKAVRLLSHMLARRDQWLSPVTAVATNNDEALTARLLDRAIRALREDMQAQLKARLSAGDLDMLAILADLLGLENDWQALFRVLVTKSGNLRKRLTAKEGLDDAEHKRSFNEWLASLRERELETLISSYTRVPATHASDAGSPAASQLRMLHLCCVCLSLAAAELDALLSEAGLLDFTGLLLRAKMALRDEHGPTDLALYLDYRIRHILVDEYQDTSRSQFEFFNLLTESWQPDDGTTFFAVGDPMQSIYRFRDADVSIFADSRQHGLDNVALTSCILEANFRSYPTVVHWCNRLFSDLFGSVNATQLGEVSFNPAIPMVAGAEGAKVQCLQFGDALDETQAVVAHIQALLASEADTSIAVLCRARTHLTPLLDALANLGIGVQATDMDLLANRAVINDLMSLHSILLQPAQRLGWFSLLRSPLFGVALDELTQFAEIVDFEQAVDDFHTAPPSLEAQLERLSEALGWARGRLYEVPLREVMEGLWLRCGGTAAYTPSEWRHAIAWFNLIDELGGDAYEYAAVETALQSLFADSDLKARVQIMTVHKAKGLEFDHVVVPYLDRRAASDDAQLLLWRAGAEGLLMGVHGDPVHDWLRYEERERGINEEKRLLYVACTRAKQTLFTSFSSEPDARPGGLAKWLAHLAQQQEYHPGAIRPARQHDNLQGDLFKIQHLRRLPADFRWQAPQYAGLKGAGAAPMEGAADLISARFEVALGLLVHRTLAWHATATGQDALPTRTQLLRWAQELQLVTTEHEALFASCLLQVRQTLDDPNGRWLLSAHEQAHSEWPLTGVYQGITTRVVLDRTFVAEGTRWIADFKTGQPQTDESVADFIAREVARYTPQLHKYREISAAIYPQPVAIALYFTALSHFEIVH